MGTLLAQFERKALCPYFTDGEIETWGQKLAFVQMDASSLVSTVSVLPAMASSAILGSIWDRGLATFSEGFWV